MEKIKNMVNKPIKEVNWDFFAKIIIAGFFLLQCIRWSILLQSMDIYYHLLTAWGFIQAGGYSNWDFWQYAPAGRIHIYPPLFHLLLAGLIKSGVNQIILAKLGEVVIPSLFLAVLWKFIKAHYGNRLAFLVILVFFSSFSFYLSLINHLPATLAFVFGILAWDQFFKGKLLRSGLLLAACFYTHIGLSWFFTLAFLLYVLINKEEKKGGLFILGTALILALPMIIKEAHALKFISSLGLDMRERYLSQVKVIDLLFALAGLAIALKRRGRYVLFLTFFIAGLIFLLYPYRFFSAEGYFPVILLAGLFLERLYQGINKRYVIFSIALFTLILSPTWAFYQDAGNKKISYKLRLLDSGFINLILARGQVAWFPKQYLSTAKLVKENSQEREIVFSSLNSIGLTIASLSGRATANALLPEIRLSDDYNPLLSAKIIIFTRIDDPGVTGKIISALKLVELGGNDFFVVYKNPGCQAQVKINPAILPFWLIFAIGLGVLLAFWQAGRIEGWLCYLRKK